MRNFRSQSIRLGFLFSWLALDLSGCAFRHFKADAARANLPASNQSRQSPSFTQVREQVLVPKCISCHHHQADFADYQHTFTALDDIRQKVFVERSMPENDTLTPEQSVLLKAWVDAGAPEQAQAPAPAPNVPSPAPAPRPTPSTTPSPGPSGVPAPDPMVAALESIRQTFELKISPLVKRSCVACHDSHAVPEGFLGHLPGIRGHEWKHIRLASRMLDFSRTFPDWSAQTSSAIFFLDRIRSALVRGAMPPQDFKLVHELDGRLLKPLERETIVEWTIDSERLLAQADASRPTAAKVLQNRCLGCHSAQIHNGGLVLETDGAVFKIPQGNADGIPFITLGSPEDSALYLVLLADPAARHGLSAMPRESSPLSPQERDLVYDWIKGLHR